MSINIQHLHEPPRSPRYGFLWLPPYRVQGYSVAGEQTSVHIPEMNLGFDIGSCCRFTLNSGMIALTHGHMDHVAGIAYYFSQRHFQGMGIGTLFCHHALEKPIQRLMDAWVDIEGQRTPYRLKPMAPGTETQTIELRNNLVLRCFQTNHTEHSLGFAAVEHRRKLRPEFAGQSQDQLVKLKRDGVDITYVQEIPQIAYLGDTAPGDFFDLPEVRDAKILITECTFLDAAHRSRARSGKHLHVKDLARVMPKLNCEAIVLTHLSRRTHMQSARELLDRTISDVDKQRLFVLQDHRANRERYQQQCRDIEAEAENRQPDPTA